MIVLIVTLITGQVYQQKFKNLSDCIETASKIESSRRIQKVCKVNLKPTKEEKNDNNDNGNIGTNRTYN
ncbi:MAG: hypothetical protein KDK54_19720 [Leptospiraceae bacterium]|nr:hypothetical protein [Leptospiraceae bacterium]